MYFCHEIFALNITRIHSFYKFIIFVVFVLTVCARVCQKRNVICSPLFSDSDSDSEIEGVPIPVLQPTHGGADPSPPQTGPHTLTCMDLGWDGGADPIPPPKRALIHLPVWI